jgi:hypothetical protein
MPSPRQLHQARVCSLLLLCFQLSFGTITKAHAEVPEETVPSADPSPQSSLPWWRNPNHPWSVQSKSRRDFRPGSEKEKLDLDYSWGSFCSNVLRKVVATPLGLLGAAAGLSVPIYFFGPGLYDKWTAGQRAEAAKKAEQESAAMIKNIVDPLHRNKPIYDDDFLPAAKHLLDSLVKNPYGILDLQQLLNHYKTVGANLDIRATNLNTDDPVALANQLGMGIDTEGKRTFAPQDRTLEEARTYPELVKAVSRIIAVEAKATIPENGTVAVPGTNALGIMTFIEREQIPRTIETQNKKLWDAPVSKLLAPTNRSQPLPPLHVYDMELALSVRRQMERKSPKALFELRKQLISLAKRDRALVVLLNESKIPFEEGENESAKNEKWLDFLGRPNVYNRPTVNNIEAITHRNELDSIVSEILFDYGKSHSNLTSRQIVKELFNWDLGSK